jgi:hypothetical protein
MATFNSANGNYQSGNKTLFETQMLAISNGHVVDSNNRLPVDIGNTTINISGNVNISTPNTITVNSSPSDPVHVHLTEIGTSGILNVDYMPIGGNVVVSNGYPTTQNVAFSNQTIFINGGASNVNVTNLPASQNTNIHHSNGDNISKTEPLPIYLTSIPNLDNAPWNVQVARGLVAGVSQVNLFAFSNAVSTSWVPVWENATTYSFPASALTMTLASTSASDDTSCKVLISGLNSAWAPISEVVTLNGTANVTTTNQFLRINSMILTQPGTGQLGNVGTITVKNSGTIYGQINPTISRMQNSWYTVPAGKTLYVSRVTAFSGDSAGASKFMNTRVDVHNNVNNVNFILVQLTWSDYYEVPRDNLQAYTEKSDVRWEAMTSQGTYSCAFVIQGLLIDN